MIEPRIIAIEPLTPESFSEFGDVIEVSEHNHHYTINKGFTERYHNLAQVDVNSHEGQATINIFRSTPLSLPLNLTLLERHPLSSQAFIPMGTQPYLVVVAPKGSLREDDIRIFLASSDQGVNYYAGTWHHFCLALNEISDFIVVDRIATNKANNPNNCDEQVLDTPIEVTGTTITNAVKQLKNKGAVNDDCC